MRSSKFACVLILLTGVAACSRDQPPVAAVQPEQAALTADKQAARMAELMRVIFADRFDAKRGAALAAIPVEGKEAYHLMSPVGVNDLPDGRTILIVNGSPASEDGTDMAAHASAGVLNVYALRRDGSHWTVTARWENVDFLGSSGMIGRVKWVGLGPGRPGFIVSNGGVWQGYWIRGAAIYSLEAQLRRMGGFAEGSGNEGACVPEMTEQCWHVEGDIRFATEPQEGGYQDIVVDFTDKRFTVTEDAKGQAVEHIKSQTKQSARYHFDGKEYVLVSGTNPVPGI